MGPVSAEDHSRAAIAVTVTTGFVLPRIPHIEDADRPHEIELWPADIDVRAVLSKPQREVCGDEIIYWQGLERSTAVGPVQGFKSAARVAWWLIALIGGAHRTPPDLQRRFHGPGCNPPDELGSSPGARGGSGPPARQAQEDRAIDRVGLRAGGCRQRKTYCSQSDSDRGEDLLE